MLSACENRQKWLGHAGTSTLGKMFYLRIPESIKIDYSFVESHAREMMGLRWQKGLQVYEARRGIQC